MNTIASETRWNLVQRYADGLASAEDVAELEIELLADGEFRSAFLDYLNLDAALEGTLLQGPLPKISDFPATRKKGLSPFVKLAAAFAIIAAGALITAQVLSNPNLATIEVVSSDARWLSEPLASGSRLKKDQLLELAVGSAEVRFQSGALTRIHGPARFRILTDNSGFLSYGDAYSIASNEASKGFTIATHSGDFVDQGTEFLTSANADGFSQLHVKSGAVDVDVPGMKRQRLKKGSGLGIEPGEVPVLIRIEQGDETPEFRFPTIPPPGTSDFADAQRGMAEVNWWPGNTPDESYQLSGNSGPFALLLDGSGQTGEDHPAESVFFRDGSKGLILIDLGSEIPVSKIHTYSWHRNFEDPDLRRRAVQRYTLWGAGNALPKIRPGEDSNESWTRIARVNTDAFFKVKEEPDRPAQQACAIFAGDQAIGTFRYLLFEFSPTPMPDGARPRHTFLGEIDVFASQEN